MVTRGRNICNTLKAIRKQIADANGIDYSPEECNYKGECMGTCPKCEQDVRDLEYELHLRQMAGKAIKVAGIAAGLVAMTACSDGKVQRISSDATKSELNIVKEEVPKPGDRQLEGDISFSDEAKYAEEENRKLGEIPSNPRMEITKERTSNDRKGTTSKKCCYNSEKCKDFCQPFEFISHSILDIIHRSSGDFTFSSFTRNFTARSASAYFVVIPRSADTHIQNIAPGPPIRRAVATPTILPVPISAASVVQSVANGDTSPAPSSFSKILFSALGNLHICIPRNLYVKYRPVPIRSTNVGGPQTNV